MGTRKHDHVLLRPRFGKHKVRSFKQRGASGEEKDTFIVSVLSSVQCSVVLCGTAGVRTRVKGQEQKTS